MQRIVAISYSQSGQTERALELYLQRRAARAPIEVEHFRLHRRAGISYPFPWSFFSFLRALPDSVRPGKVDGAARTASEDGTEKYQSALRGADLVVLAYPVWFLSPAAPVADFLRSLGDGALEGKAVHTLATCRNMWVQAQLTLRTLVEGKGGHVTAHAVLEDRGPTYATLVTTPRFFLTGRRGFAGGIWRRLFPPFGITEKEYAHFASWVDELDARPVFCTFNAPMALAECVGKTIFRLLLIPWPLVRGRGALLERLYLSIVAACTILGIILLMPPLVLAGRLWPLRARLSSWQSELCSARPPNNEEEWSGSAERVSSTVVSIGRSST